MSDEPDNDRPAEIIRRPQSDGLSLVGVPWFCPSTLVNRPTSLDFNTEEGLAALANVELESDFTLDDLTDLEFYCCHYAVIGREMIDSVTGEHKAFPSVTFFDPDGRRFTTTSEVVLRRLSTIIKLYPNTPWNPPLRLLFRRVLNKGSKRTYHQLEVLPRK
jgi:hypothetical protein